MNFTDDKKTRWFPARLNPARAGWYEVRWQVGGHAGMRYFQRGSWFYGENIESGMSIFGAGNVKHGEAWRGLKEQA